MRNKHSTLHLNESAVVFVNVPHDIVPIEVEVAAGGGGDALVSLWRWEKTEYLVPVRFGGKVRYRMSDINNIINQQKSEEQ